MEVLEKIDVTVLRSEMKHRIIFEKIDELQGGESIIISNDHDPKPLYYELVNERGLVFEWEYLEQGPLIWQVKITKAFSDEKEKTIGEIVSDDYRKAEVFKKFKIDFCCGGKKTIAQACIDKGVDLIELKKELRDIDSQSKSPSQRYNTWPLDFLVDYILNTHHSYVSESIPLLLEYTKKVAKVHGAEHVEMIVVAEKIQDAANELTSHMYKEEKILFPYIKKLVSAQASSEKINREFGGILNPIQAMEHEHELVGDIFKTIRSVTNNYTPPADACNTFRVTLKKLEEFEDDLHQHIHLENNILFPKSEELEKRIC